jgi:hypothetical protein
MGILSPETEVVETEVEAAEVETVETDAPAEESTPEPKVESARETTARVLKELESGKTDEQINAPKAKEAKVVKQAENPDDVVDPAAVAKELEIDPDLIPPARLDAREQQVFNNLPKTLKRAFSRSIKNIESMTTKEKAELARETQETRSIRDAVQPFATEWAEQGFSVPAAMATLAANHQKLTSPDFNTKLRKYVEIGQSIGIDLAKLPELLGQLNSGQPVAPTSISEHPEFKQLHQTVTSLQSDREQAQIQAAAAPIAEEMRAVQHEVDAATGQYRYPELHDDNYLESLKPLVSTLVATVPGLGYGEALRRAHYSRQGFGAPNQATQTRLPAAPAQRTQTTTPGATQPPRAVSAAVTVRGASAPTVSKGAVGEPPPEALRSAHATTRWALEQLRLGNNV